ncbi:MAG: hypothetical protein GXO47_05800 [Chlorobi bacterium]|nr:hypothetical protein [Chlorobiota bacterium]
MDVYCRYIDDESILIRELKGEGDFKEIYNLWLRLIEEGGLRPDMKGVINDLREAGLLMDVHEIHKLIDLFEENIELFSRIKIAVVVSSYKNIVFPMVGNKISKKIQIKPFSTIEAARNWINDDY